MDSKKKKKKKGGTSYRSDVVFPSGNVTRILIMPNKADAWNGGPEMAHRHVDEVDGPPGVLAQLHEDSLLAMKARRSGMKGGMVIPGGTFNGRIESGPLLKESISRAWQNEMYNDLFDL